MEMELVDIVLDALNQLYIDAVEKCPKFVKKEKRISVLDIKPCGILEFMLKNDIPNESWFIGTPNAYDAYDDFCIEWEIEVPANQKDNECYVRNYFNANAYYRVRKEAIANGYKGRYAVPQCTRDEYMSVYDMYQNINEDGMFKKLDEYFSSLFHK